MSKTLNTSRAIIFAHYDKHKLVDDYVYFYLDKLQKVSNYMVFVSVVELTQNEINKLKTICDDVILRDNVGYDFMSYRVGLESFDHKLYDEVVICNDSVYGPFYSLRVIFDSMQEKKCDFWGITSGDEIAYHLQSYFVVFKKKVLHSKAFQKFWRDVEVLESKSDIIKKYEIGLTQQLLTRGFTGLSYIDHKPNMLKTFKERLKRLTPSKIIVKVSLLMQGKYKIQDSFTVSIMHEDWKELVVYKKAPFIKIELLRDNPVTVQIDDYEDVIKSISDYDVALIKQHLQRVGKR